MSCWYIGVTDEPSDTAGGHEPCRWWIGEDGEIYNEGRVVVKRLLRNSYAPVWIPARRTFGNLGFDLMRSLQVTAIESGVRL